MSIGNQRCVRACVFSNQETPRFVFFGCFVTLFSSGVVSCGFRQFTYFCVLGDQDFSLLEGVSVIEKCNAVFCLLFEARPLSLVVTLFFYFGGKQCEEWFVFVVSVASLSVS